MKFLALSLLGLSMFTQQSQAQFNNLFNNQFLNPGTNFLNSGFTTNPIAGSNVFGSTGFNSFDNGQNIAGQTINNGINSFDFGSTNSNLNNNGFNLPNFGFNTGFQMSNLNFQTPLAPTQNNTFTNNGSSQNSTLVNNGSFQGNLNNLNSNIQQNLGTKFNNLPKISTFKAQRYAGGNNIEALNPQKWQIFDDMQQFCKNPRIWTNNQCMCPNNAIFVSGKCMNQIPTLIDDALSLRFINRKHDGTQNNLNKPLLGAKATNTRRLCSPNYEDGISIMWKQLPNPRVVSNVIGAMTGPLQPNKIPINMLFVQWGQFIDHDIVLSPGGNTETENIPIPMCDKFMDKDCKGTQFFPFSRTLFDANQKERININLNTHWLDASQIYGSDKQTADGLRQLSKGKLKTSTGNIVPKDQNGQFFAGDFRISQNVALSIFHVTFLREHNRICDLVLSKNPNLTDEQVYQIAKNYVTGLYQHITYDQYLPILLGKDNFDRLIGPYKYDSNADPSIITEFSTAAYRLGHPFVNAPYKMTDSNGNLIRDLKLGQMFFNPSLITNESVDQLFNGLARLPAKQRSLQIVDDLRNFLFFPPNNVVKFDLYSLNIQRARDHGICSFNDARQKAGLPRKQNFNQIFADQKKAEILEKLYQNPNKLDMWLGIIGQPSVNGSVLGELGVALNSLQFKNIRNADRLWYENVYPASVVKQIKATTFADVIKRNTNVRNINNIAFRRI